jgi:hypothetical protein
MLRAAHDCLKKHTDRFLTNANWKSPFIGDRTGEKGWVAGQFLLRYEHSLGTRANNSQSPTEFSTYT